MSDELKGRARFVVQLFRECDAIQLPHRPTEEVLLGMIDRIEELEAKLSATPSPDAILDAALEAAIRAVEPSYDEPSVDPSNMGDVAQYAAWCSDMRSADLIRALAADPEKQAAILKAAEGRG